MYVRRYLSPARYRKSFKQTDTSVIVRQERPRRIAMGGTKNCSWPYTVVGPIWVVLVLGFILQIGAEYKTINSSEECDKLEAFPHYQHTAYGLNARTGKIPDSVIFKRDLKDGNGSCLTTKIEGQWLKIPLYADALLRKTHRQSDYIRIQSVYTATNLYNNTKSMHINFLKSIKATLPLKVPASALLEMQVRANGRHSVSVFTYKEEMSALYRHKGIIQTHSMTYKFLQNVQLHQGFITAVKQLPVSYHDKDDPRRERYMLFFSRYGHLVPVRLDFGGYFTLFVGISACSTEKESLLSKSEKVAADLKVAVETMMLGGMINTGLDREKATQEYKKLTQKHEIHLGSVYFRGGEEKGKLLLSKLEGLIDWVPTIRSRPAVIGGDYRPIHDMLNHPDFHDLPYREDVQENMRQILTDEIKDDLKEDLRYVICEMKELNQCVCTTHETSATPGKGCCDGASSNRTNNASIAKRSTVVASGVVVIFIVIISSFCVAGM